MRMGRRFLRAGKFQALALLTEMNDSTLTAIAHSASYKAKEWTEMEVLPSLSRVQKACGNCMLYRLGSGSDDRIGQIIFVFCRVAVVRKSG